MNKIVNDLKNSGTFFLSTLEQSQPRVCPHGFVMEYNNQICMTTSHLKPTYKQLLENPQIKVCAMLPDQVWIRLRGKVKFITSAESKQAALKAMPQLLHNYGTDEVMEVFTIENAIADYYSFGPSGIQVETRKGE